MVYVVKLKPSAEKELAKIPEKYRLRILTGLVILRKEPFSGKKLAGEFKDYYSLRIWPYRIIYTIYKTKLLVIVICIGHRQGIYKRNN